MSHSAIQGVTNDGQAHVVEYYYPETGLRRAEGKPLADIVRAIHQSLYSGEYNDPTGLAERTEVNAEQIRLHKVYHGSAADFDVFDHSHMGEGEGAQAYGWGSYLTEVEGIGRTYAKANVKATPEEMAAERDYWDKSNLASGSRQRCDYLAEKIEECRNWIDALPRMEGERQELVGKHGEDSDEVKDWDFYHADDIDRLRHDIPYYEQRLSEYQDELNKEGER